MTACFGLEKSNYDERDLGYILLLVSGFLTIFKILVRAVRLSSVMRGGELSQSCPLFSKYILSIGRQLSYKLDMPFHKGIIYTCIHCDFILLLPTICCLINISGIPQVNY